jgi:hypothetical protein
VAYCIEIGANKADRLWCVRFNTSGAIGIGAILFIIFWSLAVYQQLGGQIPYNSWLGAGDGYTESIGQAERQSATASAGRAANDSVPGSPEKVAKEVEQDV